MPKRRGKPLENVAGVKPPAVVPTVWANWSPAPDGLTAQALRPYLEAMDEIAGGETLPTEPEQQELARRMYDVYVAATNERHQEHE